MHLSKAHACTLLCALMHTWCFSRLTFLVTKNSLPSQSISPKQFISAALPYVLHYNACCKTSLIAHDTAVQSCHPFPCKTAEEGRRPSGSIVFGLHNIAPRCKEVDSARWRGTGARLGWGYGCEGLEAHCRGGGRGQVLGNGGKYLQCGRVK